MAQPDHFDGILAAGGDFGGNACLFQHPMDHGHQGLGMGKIPIGEFLRQKTSLKAGPGLAAEFSRKILLSRKAGLSL